MTLVNSKFTQPDVVLLQQGSGDVIIEPDLLEAAETRLAHGDDRDEVIADTAMAMMLHEDAADDLRTLEQPTTNVLAGERTFKAIQVGVKRAFAKAVKALPINILSATGADGALDVLESSLPKLIESPLAKAFVAGAEIGEDRVPKRRALAAKKKGANVEGGYSFDEANEQAAKWARAHAAELAKGLTKTTRKAIREAVANSFEDPDAPNLYDTIAGILGDEDRANVIAHHEAMNAVHEGQRAAWDDAIANGWLDEKAKRRWIATPGACDECADLHGELATMDGTYPGGIEGPPKHVNCMCDEEIDESSLETI